MSEAFERRLRDEAARDATRFDPALHARVMDRVRRVEDVGGVEDATPIAPRWPWPAATAMAAGIAAMAWVMWPAQRPARVPDVAGATDRSVGRLLAPADAMVALPVDDWTQGAAGVSRFVGAQVDLAMSYRPARRPPT